MCLYSHVLLSLEAKTKLQGAYSICILPLILSVCIPKGKALLLHSLKTAVNLSMLNADTILFSRIHRPHPSSVIYRLPTLGLNPGWGHVLHFSYHVSGI